MATLGFHEVPYPTDRPRTDDAGPVACPHCGGLRPDDHEGAALCHPCARVGHRYRLVGAEEMAWMAGQAEALDRECIAAGGRTDHVAARRLRRYAAALRREENN